MSDESSLITQFLLSLINRAATVLRAARTSLRIRMKSLLVVNRDLFARLNISQGKKQDVAIKRPHITVRLARVVDVMSSVAAACAVQAPASIDIADAQNATVARALLRFKIRYSFACVLGDLSAAFEKNGCETTAAVDF